MDSDALDAAALIARAIGMPAPAGDSGASWAWSSEPFADGLFGDYAGEVALKARRVDLLPRLTAREFRAKLRFGKDEFAVDDMTGAICRRTAGRAVVVSLRRRRLEGAGQDFARPAPTPRACCRRARGRRSPARSVLSADVEGAGLSPVALIGSLQGAGKIALSDAQLAGLDPRAFDAVTRAVDRACRSIRRAFPMR